MEAFGSDIIVTIFQWIGVLFNFVFGLFLILAGWLVNVATTYNFQILDSSNRILEVGWLTARDIANLGFLILAIGSALATVLRYPPDYDARRLLPKFVAAAILVNFSMTLAAIPIQASNTLTGFFLSRVTSVQNSTLSEVGKSIFSIDIAGPLVGILGPQKLLVGETDPLPPDPGDSAGGAISAVLFASLATLIFNIVFTLLMAILLMAFALMLISRYFILTFLIIFAPIACLAFVFPALKPQFSQWSSNYIKWVMIGPSMMFFVYMAIMVAENLPGNALNVGGNVAVAGLGALLTQFINLSFVTAILVMGLMAAGKTGTAAGKGALGAANALGGGAKKFIKERKDKFMQGGAQTPFGQKLQKAFKATSESLDIKEGDGAIKRIWKKGLATTGVGQAIGVIGNKKGLYGTLDNEMLIGAGLKDKKDKSPESKKDVEKELGELQKQRATMVGRGLDVKDVDEKIKTSQRKLYKFRREEMEADYSQSTEEDLDKAIRNSDQGKNKEKTKKESEFKLGSLGENGKLGIESVNLEETDVKKLMGEAQKIVDQKENIQKDLKEFTKGIQEDPANEKSEVIQTVSREKLKDEKKIISEKVTKLKELKKAAEKAKEKVSAEIYAKALGVMQNVEYALDNELKKRAEEIQTLGSIRKRRESAETQVENSLKGIRGGDTEEEEGDEYKYGTNEDGEEKTV
jgi:hypothetical protein